MRVDPRTASGLLRDFISVVNPPAIRSQGKIVQGIHEWEQKISHLMSRYACAPLRQDLKTAILIGMLPAEYQNMVLQQERMQSEEGIEYNPPRDYILSAVVNRRQ